MNLTSIRKELYAMFPGTHASIADLGDIAAGDSIDDLTFALKNRCSFNQK
jgi:hypothetical protein